VAATPSVDDLLSRYRAMRDFSRTTEPDGAAAPPPSADRRFVIQEHHATALHWDFRLERDGVLVSWAVPKGLPVDPKTNHLAVQTEDHPLAYLDFAGEIPAGEYGGGKVIPWDRGTYELHKWSDDEVMVTLHGRRVQGKYVLFRTSGRDWMVHRMDPPQDPDWEPMPSKVEPMLARPAERLPADSGAWAYEVKWDGVRAIAFVEGGRLRLQSRKLLDMTKQFPELAGLGEALGATRVVLDGEIVAFDTAGKPSFERLQDRLNLLRPGDVRRRMVSTPVTYLLFDLLYLDGRSTMALTYRDRRELLAALQLNGPHWQTPQWHVGEGTALFEATRAQGLEGVIAKRLDSLYEPGRRSGAWLKIKHHLRQEFVIGGWTPGAGHRDATLGALLLGYYERAPGGDAPPRLHYAGKVGTGFTDRSLRDLLQRLQELRRETSPFDVGTPEPGAIFVEPELVADVAFHQWTEAGTLRAPSFVGLRDDKDARDVVREMAEDVEGDPGPGVTGRPGPGARREARESGRRRTARTAEGAGAARPARVEVGGRTLTLSNLEKPLYPSGFTKAEVIDYYTRVAPAMLPHIQGRPMTLKRYPDGSDGPFFYEKECPSHRPAWIRTAPVYSRSNARTVNYCLVDDLPTLVWLANLAALELHPLLARVDDLERPTHVVFDLDPGPPAGLIACARVAIYLKILFDAVGLQSVVKTSGSKGLQVYVPLNSPVTYGQTKAFAQAVARLLEREHPREVVSTMSKAVRPGKVFIDWSQNDEHKTAVAVYSLRARERPFVSTPVSWDEVEAAAATNNPEVLAFDAPAVLARVAERGDLFAPLLTVEQQLPGLP
jgi:bifunctional non-homologous end joining protein LigD